MCIFRLPNYVLLFCHKHGEVINETQVDQSNLNIRVYNSDYRNENLSILNDKDGDIKPFTILGEKNIDIEKKITNANEYMRIMALRYLMLKKQLASTHDSLSFLVCCLYCLRCFGGSQGDHLTTSKASKGVVGKQTKEHP